MKRGINYPAVAVSGLIVAIGLILAARQFPLPLAREIFGYGGGQGFARSAPPPPACPGSGRLGDPYVFTGGCKGQAASPDGRYLIVKNGAPGEGVGLVRGTDGASLDDLGQFDDGQGFTVGWSPQGEWFFVDRPSGASLYRVQDDRAVPDAALAVATRNAAASGCVPAQIEARRWLADGRRIVLMVRPKPGCAWQWMIGDAESGKIDPASLRRSRSDDVPADGPYALP